jgi:hypothetical protein
MGSTPGPELGSNSLGVGPSPIPRSRFTARHVGRGTRTDVARRVSFKKMRGGKMTRGKSQDTAQRVGSLRPMVWTRERSSYYLVGHNR